MKLNRILLAGVMAAAGAIGAHAAELSLASGSVTGSLAAQATVNGETASFETVLDDLSGAGFLLGAGDSDASRALTPTGTVSHLWSAIASLDTTLDPVSAAFRLFDRACFGSHPAALPVIGPRRHIESFTRADLLSDLRHEAKRQAYQWLCSACYYVFPAAVAQADEIPEPFGVWVLHGEPEVGRFEMLRPARHVACALPFAVWLALAKATPMHNEDEAAQALLGEAPHELR